MSMPGSPSSPAATGFAASQRILAAVLMSTLVAMCLPLALVQTGSIGTLPAVWVPLLQVAAGLLIAVLIRLTTGQVQVLDPGLSESEAGVVARQRYYANVMVRFVLTESVAIVSIALGFSVQEDALFLTYLGGALVSLVLMWRFVWPTRSHVTALADRLEARGRHSGLREAFGIDNGPGSGGPVIQEL